MAFLSRMDFLSPPELSCGSSLLQSSQKHRGFGFVTFVEKEDAAAAMDNMHCAELFGRVLTVNIAAPQKIKGGETGWASQPGEVSTFATFASFMADSELWTLKSGCKVIQCYLLFPPLRNPLQRRRLIGSLCMFVGLNSCPALPAVWADADTWFERQQQETDAQQLAKEHAASAAQAGVSNGGSSEVEAAVPDAMAAAEAEALAAA